MPSPRILIFSPLSHSVVCTRARGMILYLRYLKDWDIDFRTTLTPTPVELQEALQPPPAGIISAIADPRLDAILEKSGIPLIRIIPFVGEERVPGVHWDDRAIGRMAAQHFLSQDYPFYACLTLQHPMMRERALGFEEALREAQHEVEILSISSFDQDAKVLDAWIRDLPSGTALFCCNDYAAWRVNRHLQQANRNIPMDVALLGVDNDESFCFLCRPPLSSIALPAEALGYEIARQLDLHIQGGPPLRESILFSPTEVIERQSSNRIAMEDADVAWVLQKIQERCTEGIHVEDLLEERLISRRKIERKFQRFLGHGILEEIHRARIRRAQDILAHTDLPISLVCAAVGFGSFSSFNRVFLKYTGTTPREWRKRTRPRSSK